MHDERIDVGRDRSDEGREELVVVAVIDADTAFDRHRQRRRVAQRPNAVGHQRRAQHETCAKRAVLDSIARAAHVEIDLRKSSGGADARGHAKFLGIAAAQLQTDRVFGRMVLEQAARIAAHQRGGDNHLGVQQRMRRVQTMHVTAVTVRPIHHRCNIKSSV